ncbi:MAG: glycoside hydrolase family 2 protein, partial [Bacilli bacterium]|nr:glycoside hydrolase family 2 protein [Bacilli bacterium]
VSAFLRPKGNVLTLFVDGSEDPTIPPFGKVVDYLTYCGIYREVYLTSHPSSYIEDVFVSGSSDGTIKVQTKIHGEGSPHYALYDEGRLLAEFDGSSFHYDCPKVWGVGSPHLYELEAQLGEDRKRVRFGFRDAKFQPEGFFLNGKRLTLVGLNRHQTYPYFGPAAPKSLQYDDADLLKSSGINLVRTSHYPQSEHFLDRCDELGLMVVDEIPGWQYIGQDKKWRENCRDFARRMIVKERNHPCLIAYGLRIDESPDDDELYSSLQAIKEELDPGRQSLGVRNFKDSHCLEDVYGYNDFSCDSLEHGVDPSGQLKGGKGKALLITESNGHMFPTKSFDPTSRRVEHALRHAKVLDEAVGDRGYCGAITWCAFDYGTHRDFGSGDHICHHGVYDIYRSPKYAASFFKSQGKTPFIDVASLLQPGDFDAALMPKIYVFTNAEYVEMYRGEHRIGRFYPNRKDYPHLPHPPIVIDDIIGDMFNEPNISPEDGKKIVATFNWCAQNGYGALRVRDKLFLARMMAKYHLDFSYVYATYAKYVQSWGESSSLWRFEAFKDGKRFATITRGPSTDFHLEVKPTRDTLVHGATYDCVRIGIAKKDQYGTTMPYASDPVEVTVEGPIEVYGPRIFSLYGGASALYIRSLPCKNPTEATVHVTCLGETIDCLLVVRPA